MEKDGSLSWRKDTDINFDHFFSMSGENEDNDGKDDQNIFEEGM